jgi:hypothetical protein
MNKTPFKAGDRVVFNKGEGAYGDIHHLTSGSTYIVLRTRDNNCGRHQLLWVLNDQGIEVSTFAHRVAAKLEASTGFKKGDRILFKDVPDNYATGYAITPGKTYTAAEDQGETTSSSCIKIENDTGNTCAPYARRFELVKSAADIQAERGKRKAVEAERKKSGLSRAHELRLGQIVGLVKKPLLFAELSASAVHEAIESAIKAKLSGLSGIKVVGIEKTTEGYKVTLGQYA